MADNFFKISKGVNLKGTASAPSSPEAGDIYYNTTSNTFNVYDGSSWRVMTLNDAEQTLVSKDIDGGTASDTSRITLPKDTKANLDLLTRKEGTMVWATDEQKFYLDNGLSLVEVSGGGGGLTTANISSAATATVNTHYLTDSTGGAFAIALPAGQAGDVIRFSDASRTWHTDNVTLTPDGSETINGDPNLVLDIQGTWVQLMWDGSKWVTDDAIVPSTGGSIVTNDAPITDNAVARGNGGANGVQDSGILIDDSNNVTGVNDLTVAADLTVDTDTLVVDSANDRVGIGTASPDVALHVHNNTLSTVEISAGTQNSAQGGFGFTANQGTGVAQFIIDGGFEEGDIGQGSDYSTITQNGTDLTIDNRTSDIIFSTQATERLRIDHSSNAVDLGSGTSLFMNGTFLLGGSEQKYFSGSFASGSFVDIPITTGRGYIFYVYLNNIGNGNANYFTQAIAKTRNPAFGAGNTVTVIATAAGSTGTPGEITGVSLSIISGTALRVTASSNNSVAYRIITHSF